MLRTQRVLLNDEQTAVGIAAVFIAAAEDAGGRRMEMAVLKDTYQRLWGTASGCSPRTPAISSAGRPPFPPPR